MLAARRGSVRATVAAAHAASVIATSIASRATPITAVTVTAAACTAVPSRPRAVPSAANAAAIATQRQLQRMVDSSLFLAPEKLP